MMTVLIGWAAVQDMSQILERLGSQDRDERNEARQELLQQDEERLQELARYRDAIEAFQRAVQESNTYDRALQDYEQALGRESQDRVQEAMRMFQEAIDAQPDAYDRALEDYERAMSGIRPRLADQAAQELLAVQRLQELANRLTGEAPRVEMEEGEDGWIFRLVRGDQEIYRAAIPQAQLPQNFPPVQVQRGSSVRSESRSVNGESHCRVEIDGQVVYDGPGSSVSSTVRDDNGQRFVEVVVDGRVVYRAGQAPAQPPQNQPQDRR